MVAAQRWPPDCCNSEVTKLPAVMLLVTRQTSKVKGAVRGWSAASPEHSKRDGAVAGNNGCRGKTVGDEGAGGIASRQQAVGGEGELPAVLDCFASELQREGRSPESLMRR